MAERNEKKNEKNFFLVQNLDGLLPTGWARHRAHMRGRGRCRQLGARAQGAADVCGRVRALAGVRGRAHGVHAQAGKRADVRALGARGAGSTRQGATGRAVGRGRTRGRARQARGLGAAWACSWARLGVLVHLTQFLGRFDSVVS